MQYLLEAVPILEVNAFNIAYFAIISKGKLEESGKVAIIAAQIQNNLSTEGIMQFNKMLQKYPEQQQRFDDFFNKNERLYRNSILC